MIRRKTTKPPTTATVAQHRRHGLLRPAPLLNEAQLAVVTEQVLQPVVDGLRERARPMSVLYAGLMVAGDDLRVLEFNCRFGDPEAQAILPLLENDLLVLDACRRPPASRAALASLHHCLRGAGPGSYPGAYQRGLPIEGLDRALPSTTWWSFMRAPASPTGRCSPMAGGCWASPPGRPTCAQPASALMPPSISSNGPALSPGATSGPRAQETAMTQSAYARSGSISMPATVRELMKAVRSTSGPEVLLGIGVRGAVRCWPPARHAPSSAGGLDRRCGHQDDGGLGAAQLPHAGAGHRQPLRQ